MAFSNTDLAAINAAIASGEKIVKTADGKMVEVRDMAELFLAKQAILAEIASTSGATARPYPRHQLADFSD